MIIEGYGITLKRLTEKELELVRYWRNSFVVKKFMEFRGYITPLMQKQWFANINNIQNNYFLIYAEGKAIGLISGSQIDWEEGVTNNGGIFIWDLDYQETFFPSKASILLTDVSFCLGLKKTYAKILKDNIRSVSFNKLLGYKLTEGQEDQVNQSYVLTSESYFNSVQLIRKVIEAEGEIKLVIDDKNDASSKFIVDRLNTIKNEWSPKIVVTHQ